MESVKIIRALSELKEELLLLEGQSREMAKRRLFFSFKETDIYVHLYKDHRVSLKICHLYILNSKINFICAAKTNLYFLINTMLGQYYGYDWYQMNTYKISGKDMAVLTNILNQMVIDFGYYKD